jgi:dihydrofolate synthase/folylpolyglutamate synthase
VADPRADPSGWLAGLDLIGWKFGLERIRRVCELLGVPQNRYGSIHVVGSNGKSSVATMTAALLREHGLSTGAYLSPHLERWSERIRIGPAEIGAEEFGEAVERVAEAVAVAERGLEDGERVTQFEAGTATAFLALARAKVDVAVIEAGLGGRLDATNVIPSKVTALCSISLEHTDLLGDTEEEIAAEKLAVLRPHSTLVVGGVSTGVAELAEAIARERSAAIVRVPEATAEVPDSVTGAYPRRNFAVAMAAAAVYLGEDLESHAVERAARDSRLPARLETIPGEPPLILDAAHNPAGVEAVVESLPELARGAPVVSVLAALSEKPIDGICAPLAAACEVVVCTEVPAAALAGVGRPGARSHPATELAAAVERSGGRAEAEPDPERALARARALAAKRGGVVLVVGSFYLLRAVRG